MHCNHCPVTTEGRTLQYTESRNIGEKYICIKVFNSSHGRVSNKTFTRYFPLNSILISLTTCNVPHDMYITVNIPMKTDQKDIFF